MRQTLPLSFDAVLRAEIAVFEENCETYWCPTIANEWGVRHTFSALWAAGDKLPAAWGEIKAQAGFAELELGLPEDHGHGRWTYAQYAMAHALSKAGWTHRRIGEAIGKSKNAVTGLLYRATPWRTVADTRAGGWSAEDTAAIIHLRDVDKWKWRDIAEAVGWSECYCRLRYREIKNPKPEEPHCARV